MVSFSDPLSLYSIPALWILAYYPSGAKSFIMNKTKTWNNIQPRSNIPNVHQKKGLSPELANKLARMDGAHANGLEALTFFGLAILAGNYAGVDNVTLNTVSVIYLSLRAAYNYIYINQTNVQMAGLRSMVWFVSTWAPFYIFYKAGPAVRSA